MPVPALIDFFNDDSEDEELEDENDTKLKTGLILKFRSDFLQKSSLIAASAINHHLQFPGRGNGLWVKDYKHRGIGVTSPYDSYIEDHDRVSFVERCGWEPNEFEAFIDRQNGRLLYLIHLPRDLNPNCAPDDPINLARLARRKKDPFYSPRARLFNYFARMRGHGTFYAGQEGAGMSKTNLCDDFYWIAKCVNFLYASEVQLPGPAEKLLLAGQIEHFPTAILLTDSTFVPSEPSLEEEQPHWNVKHQAHGVLHQFCCDYTCKIRHVVTCVPGGNVDVTIFRHSDLYVHRHEILDKLDAAAPGGILPLYFKYVTDCGYLGHEDTCIFPKTLTQIRAIGRSALQQAQDMADNTRIRRARAINEISIGRTKQRWGACGQLQRQFCNDHVRIGQVFLGACILQNITWEFRGYPMQGISQLEWERRLDWFIDHNEECDRDF